MSAPNPVPTINDLNGIICFGDSISDYVYFSGNMYPGQLAKYVPGANVYSCGTAGANVAQLISRIDTTYGLADWIWFYVPFGVNGVGGPSCLANFMKCRLACVLIGTNDALFNSEPVTSYQASLAQVWASIQSLGMTVLPLTIPPFGNASAWTSAVETWRTTANTWIRNNAPGGQYVDLEVMGDQGVATPGKPVLWAAYDSGDGTHPNPIGGLYMATLVANKIRSAGYASQFGLSMSFGSSAGILTNMDSQGFREILGAPANEFGISASQNNMAYYQPGGGVPASDRCRVALDATGQNIVLVQ